MIKLFLILTILNQSYKEYFKTEDKVLILSYVYDIKPEIVSENQNHYTAKLCTELTKLGYKANKDNWYDIQLKIDDKTGSVLNNNK